MRKLILSLAILISLSASAHTFTPIGYCTVQKEAAFQASYFGKLDSVEVQYKLYNTSTWLTLPNGIYVTSANSALNNITIGVPQSDVNQPITIRYRWKTRASNGTYSNWSNWSTATAKKTSLSKCGDLFDLPVKFSAFTVTQIDPETLEVRFTTYETENVKSFNIQFSLDGKEWRTVAIVFPDTYNSNTNYKARIKVNTLK